MSRPGSLTGKLRQMAENTPESRDRHIDLLRALALCAVVLGHWTAAVVVHDDSGLDGYNLLGVLDWTHPFTWLFQVMPVFFMVGGYANAASLSSHRRKGGDDTSWLLSRTDRLLRPTTALLLVLAAGSLTAFLAGVDGDVIGTVSWLASIPLWFLVAYLAMVFMTPPAFALHRRWGLAVPAALAALVLLLDAARMGGGVPVVGQANYLFTWLAIHQIGFCWWDGQLTHRARTSALVALTGLGTLILLTSLPFSPYPVSMVAVPGEELSNTAPPTFALFALAVTQLGIALLLSGPSNRFLRRTGPWTVVVGANTVVLTIFLWHMTAVIIAGAALYWTGVMPQPEPGSGQWFLLRVPWLLFLAAVLALLVMLFSPIEGRTAAAGSGRRVGATTVLGVPVPPVLWRGLTVIALAAVLVGLLNVALAGDDYDGPAGLPGYALLSYFAGAALLRLARVKVHDRAPGSGNGRRPQGNGRSGTGSRGRPRSGE
ncbi:acyltransferase [Streptomyces sp. ACA25]|uniref:acyltransferase family protein n=1 Tax=Streptomyces sp. ACA25 TaxID=3022596 RepID=UPI00230803E5|nr:acyltransferase [Streptomyces sp. ACA25]MDB1089696.1 acyltransferase [Streptomyces sp. ACA25]